MTAQPTATADPAYSHHDLVIRRPQASDGSAVHALIERCPPLDRNSLYCNVLQCSALAGTCALAAAGSEVLGFVSGFILPEQTDVLFVWQVAVDDRARGRGLARALIRDILSRETCRGVRYVHTTVTADNAASRAMFERLATSLDTSLEARPGFDRDRHLAGRHASETLCVIGPFTLATDTALEKPTHVRTAPS